MYAPDYNVPFGPSLNSLLLPILHAGQLLSSGFVSVPTSPASFLRTVYVCATSSSQPSRRRNSERPALVLRARLRFCSMSSSQPSRRRTLKGLGEVEAPSTRAPPFSPPPSPPCSPPFSLSLFSFCRSGAHFSSSSPPGFYLWTILVLAQKPVA